MFIGEIVKAGEIGGSRRDRWKQERSVEAGEFVEAGETVEEAGETVEAKILKS
jgi:hypothetical protein